MEKKQALKMALAALKAERHAVTFDANLCDQYGATMPVCINASKRRKLLNLAIDRIEKEIGEIDKEKKQHESNRSAVCACD